MLSGIGYSASNGGIDGSRHQPAEIQEENEIQKENEASVHNADLDQ